MKKNVVFINTVSEWIRWAEKHKQPHYFDHYIYPRLHFADGTSMSLQAGYGYACYPQYDKNGNYKDVEILINRQDFPELIEYETSYDLDVFDCVPVYALEECAKRHGGIINPETKTRMFYN